MRIRDWSSDVCSSDLHLKEHQLLCDVKPGDRVFYFTPCGWMMWNWLISALASEATLLLYDGSPFAPGGNILFDSDDGATINISGTSAKYIAAENQEGRDPPAAHRPPTERQIHNP